MKLLENTTLDDATHQFLSAVIYATQFSQNLHAELDRIMNRLVLPEIKSGNLTKHWLLDLRDWCKNNSGWRDHLLATKFDEQEIRDFLIDIADQLVVLEN